MESFWLFGDLRIGWFLLLERAANLNLSLLAVKGVCFWLRTGTKDSYWRSNNRPTFIGPMESVLRLTSYVMLATREGRSYPTAVETTGKLGLVQGPMDRAIQG